MGEDRLAFFPIPSIKDSEGLFHEVWKYLEPAYLEGSSISQQEKLKERLWNGTSQAWILMDEEKILAAVVTELWDLKAKGVKVVHVPLAGGDIVNHMERMLEGFYEFAKHEGASEVILTVRPGIAKLSREFGYRTKYVEVSKSVEVSDG